jgi:8-oxo-dGTP pyrophosphatase MutT (NUDIX family)
MNHEKSWKVVKTEAGPDLKLFKARFDYLQNAHNGITERMIILEGADSTNVIPVLPNGDMLFVRQFRFGTRTTTLELPGGIVDAGEASLQAAQRELREETGYTSTRWTYLGKIPSNPVFMDSYIHHWLAEDVALTTITEMDDGELTEPVVLSRTDVRDYLKAGKLEHPHTISALTRYLL